MSDLKQLVIRNLGLQEYTKVWAAMAKFTEERDENTPDEFWLLEHPAVFTQGQAGKAEHLLMPGEIPVVQADRGGQVTYHGPGQIVGYPLVNLRRRSSGIRELVTQIENSIVATLADYDIKAYPKSDAPGVYVGDEKAFGGNTKIASLGLRVRRGCTLHGLSLNVDMDLSPFRRINPCGFQGLEMTQMKDLIDECPTLLSVEENLMKHFTDILGYDSYVLADLPSL